jgi:hypothetical protein
MADPIFGVVVRTVDTEPRPVVTADLSTIGLVGPAPLADAAVFPLNTPVKVYSNDVDMVADLGEGGYLADALRGINDQLGQLQVAATVVVVRTAEGTNADPALKLQETIANVMGSSVTKTGVWAFTKAAELLGVTPRLILAPGYTGQMANGVDDVNVTNAGTGYDPEDPPTVTFSGGGAAATIVQATGHALVNEDGTIQSIVIDTPGQWYQSAPTVTIEAPPVGGTQAEATATIDLLANPVVVGSVAVLDQLLAHMIVESSGTSEQNDTDWRETISSRRVIPLSGGVKVIDPVTGSVVVRPLAPRVAGIAVRRDHEQGAPFHSWANQPIQGIVGPGRSIPFAITDNANEGQQLLAANLGIVVRGEIGSDFALASGGFIFVGTDNAGEDELWRFYNVTRGRDYIHLGLLRALRFYLGRFNLTGHTIQAILNTMGFFLRDLQADQHILGYRVDFRGVQNSAEDIRKGWLTVAFAAEEPPVLRKITTESSRYRPAIDAMVSALEAQLNIAA